MTELSKKILDDYQVRRTKEQKLRFINLLKEYIPDLHVEEGGFLHNRNIVVGDPNTSKVIIGAHYDTCAILPMPNFVMPKNIIISILYSFVLVFVLSIPFFLVGTVVLYFYSNENIILILELLYLLYITLVMLIGVPNKHTANDNTSGVISLCEMIMHMTEEERKDVTFVFFDNEENGLFGSAFFAKEHKNILKDKLVINIDCVSDGNHFLIIENKKAKSKYHNQVMNIFRSMNNKVIHIEKSSTTYYPSDQLNFPTYIACSSMNKSKLGLYMNRIHTKRDIIFDESNITYLTNRLQELVKNI